MKPDVHHIPPPPPSSHVTMLDDPKEIMVDVEWHRLVSRNPMLNIDPQILVIEVPGGMLFRVVVPGNPVVFIPNLTLADLRAQP